jgi:hypothetical protein
MAAEIRVNLIEKFLKIYIHFQNEETVQSKVF